MREQAGLVCPHPDRGFGCTPPNPQPPQTPQVTTEDGAVVLTIERLPEDQPATGLSQRGQFDRNVVWTKKDLQYKSGWVDSWNKMWWVGGAGLAVPWGVAQAAGGWPLPAGRPGIVWPALA